MDKDWQKGQDKDQLTKDSGTGTHARKESLQNKLHKTGGKVQRKVDETAGDKALANKGADQNSAAKHRRSQTRVIRESPTAQSNNSPQVHLAYT